jgi:RNA recognition motif-containing protein
LNFLFGQFNPCLEDLINYFKSWGKIEECKIYFENTNKKGSYKGYGFILFSRKETMAQVLEENEYHTVKGCKFQCKPILLKDELKKVKEGKVIDSQMGGELQNTPDLSEYSMDDSDRMSVDMNDVT